ncbi:hypothetical protein BB560_004228 [Smittium megazygosporum]|uniref:Ribosomal protein S11 n=1 Tax=Smittium megazygosporum TaxID=133381 RepID=A0A2T9Z9S0_9FUNG|nr:hypothetical protein BB560_004228 [Smittium megazygosporum]
MTLLLPSVRVLRSSKLIANRAAFSTLGNYICESNNDHKPINPFDFPAPPELQSKGPRSPLVESFFSNQSTNTEQSQSTAFGQDLNSGNSSFTSSSFNSPPSFGQEFPIYKGDSRPLTRGLSEVYNEISHILHVNATSNNTTLALSTPEGNVLVTSSGGMAGFKKSQRAGHEAAYQATALLISKCNDKGIHISSLELRFKGLGPGRDASFKAIRGITDWVISKITDATPIPFNGCRPKKARRL